ncbi:MAG TPA: peptidase [Nitrospiraceae bacterium]|jgi:serine protease Do|nr:peptidase [Nitrospiraceae bacterium]
MNKGILAMVTKTDHVRSIMLKKRLRIIVKSVAPLLLYLFFGATSAYAVPFWTTLPPTESLQPVPLTSETVTKLVERLKPAVVNISVTQTVKSGGLPEGFRVPFGDEDFWKRFFGNQEPREFKRKGLGSGIIVSKEGYIVTNNHVVQQANDITVILFQKKQYPAKVIGTDPKTDIALIKIEADEPLAVVPLGDSDLLKEGEAVIAIGNPFGLSETVTAGIVSAKGRVIGAGPYDDFIQTDASINPGNSGGPLLNYHGEVVGINTAISATGQGIGFAVPINLAKEILVQLKEQGKVTRGWLGVSIQEVTPEIAKSFVLKEANGALISDIVPNGPADKAGFKRGDVIVELNGKMVKDYHDLPHMVALIRPGEQASFKVLRSGEEVTLSAIIGEMKDEEGVQGTRDVQKQLGMSLQPVTPEIAKELGMKKSEGVAVTDVEANSSASEAGIQRGDVILEVNQKPVNTLREFHDAVQKAKGSVLFLVYRNGATFYISLQITADQ